MRRARDERELLSLLGIDERSPWEEVRRAFRDAVRANHPDLHDGDADGEGRLKELNAAWESINSPSKWTAYLLQADSPARGGRGARTAADPSLARLRVQRQQRGSAGLLPWKLELDGKVLASIENGGTSLLDTEPGRHCMRVFYGLHSSLPLHVQLARGQELVLGCRQLESLRTRLFSPGRSLVLELLSSGRVA